MGLRAVVGGVLASHPRSSEVRCKRYACFCSSRFVLESPFPPQTVFQKVIELETRSSCQLWGPLLVSLVS